MSAQNDFDLINNLSDNSQNLINAQLDNPLIESRLQTLSGSGISSSGVLNSNFQVRQSSFGSNSRRRSSTANIVQDLYSSGAIMENAGYSTRSIQTASSNLQSGTFLSEIEQAILRSVEPIEIRSTEEIEVLGQKGLWANRQEVINWRGDIPLTQYRINEDQNPEIITKRSRIDLEYIQELAIRYLRPPTPPAPGEIIINQLKNELTPPAPPLIIRQQPARPATPEPLVIREAPPQAPAQVGRKIITISGKRLPPAPRKVIIERLAALPSKPQSVLIERWLPYAEVKRRVIYNKPTQPDPVVVKPRNVIIQWEAPRVNIKKDFKYLGVIRANPAEYVQRYASSLLEARSLPQFVLDIKTPDGLVLAADAKYNSLIELYGDVEALRLVNLEAEGLGEYRSYLQKFGPNQRDFSQIEQTLVQPIRQSESFSKQLTSASDLSAIIEQIFRSIDINNTGRITIEDAGKVVLRLNSRLGRSYGEDDVQDLFADLDTNNDGTIDFEEFKKAFANLNI